jgi:hypothetical protein
LSHGLGESPFDSPLAGDSLAAVVVLATRDCPDASSLRSQFALPENELSTLDHLERAGLVLAALEAR